MGAFSIPLSVQPPAPVNLTQTLGGLMNIKSQMVENALRQAQTATAQQETQLKQAEQQQKNRDLADQNTIQELMKDPETAKTLASGDDTPLNGKVQPTTQEKFRTAVLSHIKEKAATDSTTLGNHEKALGEIADTINGLKSYGDDLDSLNSAWGSAINGLNSSGALHAAGIDPAKVPQRITDPKQLDSFAASAGAAQAVAQKALEFKKTQQELTAKAATQAKEEAEALEKRTAAAKTQAILDMVNGAGQQTSGVHPVDAIFQASGNTDAQSQAALKAEYDATPLSFGDNPMAGKQAVLQRAGEHATSPAKAKADEAARFGVTHSPEAIAAEIKKAVDVKRAEAPIETQTAINTDMGKRTAEAKLAPPGFQGILDTATRNKAIADQIKASDEHAKAAGEAQQMEEYVKAARSGNQAAAANVPITTLRAIVNRVNRQELEAQGGQSFARKFTDWAAKGFEGKPSDLTLNDYAALGQIAQSKADTVYAGVADNINALGGQIPRTPHSSAAQSVPDPVKSVLSKAIPGIHKLSDGTTWMKAADGTITRQ